MNTVSLSVLELFRMGGVIMWPLLIFSIAAIAISLERAVYFLYYNLKLEELTAAVSEYIEKKRMQKAVELLLEGNKKTRAVWEAIGYTNSNTFFKAFKRTYGVSPSEYAKVYKE